MKNKCIALLIVFTIIMLASGCKPEDFKDCDLNNINKTPQCTVTPPTSGSDSKAGQWIAIPVDAPIARTKHGTVWTGDKMCIWGGETYSQVFGTDYLSTGMCLSFANFTWTSMTTVNAPTGRTHVEAVWTGTKMCIWGGYNGNLPYPSTGSCYNPSNDTWTTMSASPLSGRYGHQAVWTGTKMCIWGGYNNTTTLNDGACYNPSSDTWSSITNINAPSQRFRSSSVWTGDKMCIWGGDDSTGTTSLANGSCYNPSSNSWTQITSINAPAARAAHAGVWTGTQMCVWGGLDWATSSKLNSGGCYDPSANSWTSMTLTGAPPATILGSGVWTGTQMCVWGGSSNAGALNSGGCYNPSSNQWSTITQSNAPSARYFNSSIWTGSQMCIWGGNFNGLGTEFKNGSCVTF